MKCCCSATKTKNFNFGGENMLDKPSTMDLTKPLNDAFHIKLPDSKELTVELIQVNRFGEGKTGKGKSRKDRYKEDNGKREPFSILFRGPLQVYLPQSIYTVEHPKMGRIDIFLVPVGPDKKGMLFEAVFT